VRKEKVDYIKFRNEGSTPGQVEIIFEAQKEVKFEPNSFKIDPMVNREMQVKVTYAPKEAGIFRRVYDVVIDGQQQIAKQIDVNAISVQFNRFLIDETGAPLESIEFGLMYFGDTREKVAYLFNHTPKRQKFKINFKLGSHELEVC